MCVHNRIRNAPARSGTGTISVSCACSFLRYMHLNLFLVIFYFNFENIPLLPVTILRWLTFCSDKFACLLSSRRPLYFQTIFIVSDQVLKCRKVVFFWLIVFHLHVIPTNSSFKCNCIYYSLVLFFLSFDKASIYRAFCSVTNSHVTFCCSSLSLSLSGLAASHRSGVADLELLSCHPGKGLKRCVFI